MLTLNESAHVRLSVPAILGFVDELVVIDGGSTDDTVDYLKSLGDKVNVVVKPQAGDAYSKGWEQESRRQRLQEICKGDWVFQLDADEVVSDDFSSIRELTAMADSKTACFGVNRVDYAPDLYHAFMPYTAHPSIPRVWRKGSVDWNTGKVVHMTPFLSGTERAVSSFPAPTFIKTELLLHHLHRCYWIGKNKHKIRADDNRKTALSRAAKLGNYQFAIERLPDAIVPHPLLDLRVKQKASAADYLGLHDDFLSFDPSGVARDAGGDFSPDSRRGLERILASVPNPITVVEIGSGLGSSTRFLTSQVGGCVLAIDDWGQNSDYPTFLANCWEYRERMLPIRQSSANALTLPIQNVDVLFLARPTDYETASFDLRGWAPRVAANGVLCGSHWCTAPVQRAVKDFAATASAEVRSDGDFWWLTFATPTDR